MNLTSHHITPVLELEALTNGLKHPGLVVYFVEVFQDNFVFIDVLGQVEESGITLLHPIDRLH